MVCGVFCIYPDMGGEVWGGVVCSVYILIWGGEVWCVVCSVYILIWGGEVWCVVCSVYILIWGGGVVWCVLYIS